MNCSSQLVHPTAAGQARCKSCGFRACDGLGRGWTYIHPEQQVISVKHSRKESGHEAYTELTCATLRRAVLAFMLALTLLGALLPGAALAAPPGQRRSQQSLSQ